MSFFSIPLYLPLFAAAALLSGGCSKLKSGPDSSKSESVETAVVDRQDMELAINRVGELKPSVSVDVKAEITAKVKTIHVKEAGLTIKKDDLLVELDDTDLKAKKATLLTEINGSKLLLDKLSLQAARAKKLLERGLLSQEDADNKRLEAEIAKNTLERNNKQLQENEASLLKTRIMSPISGTVIDLPIVTGQVVLGGSTSGSTTTLMTLANMEQMIISVHVNQIDVVRMAIGQIVQVTLDAVDGVVLKGKISFISPQATLVNNMKGFTVKILVDNTDPGRVRPGMSVNVKIPLAKVSNALTVPVEAVFRDNGKRIVYRKEGEEFKKTFVVIGIITSDRTEIKSGLSEGDVIAMSPPKEKKK
ncbi:MAG: efflux RND transporter periplasmic adaptor subunit [Verrucomicrobiae bacterium]|nr:efflux RND transporter periplasmic adaptor subunit [Verrucomicrobiae bacterium]